MMSRIDAMMTHRHDLMYEDHDRHR